MFSKSALGRRRKTTAPEGYFPADAERTTAFDPDHQQSPKSEKKATSSSLKNFFFTQSPYHLDVIPRPVLEELVFQISEDIKARAITTPYLLLSYREHTNDALIKAFIDQVYPRNQRPITGDALLRLVRNQDPYTLAGALKWCWCRIPGGIVTWKAYNKFKQEEEAFGANPPLDSFFRIFPNCVESDNHMRLVVYFFELVMALATHGRANGMGETKLPRLAGTWAFDIRKPNSEEPTSFADGLAAWSHAAEASNHLFFAYLRWLASSQQLGFQISKPLMNLFSQIKGVYPPPPAAVYYSQGIHRLVNVPMVTLTVGKLSANPWVLLRRVAKTIRFDDPSLFYSEDDFNTLYMIFNDPNNIRPKLTQTSCDILEHISRDNSITSDHPLLIRDTWKLSYDLRAKTWSKFYNHAFIDAVTGEIRKPFSNYVYEDSQYEDVMNASIPSQELHGLPYPDSPDPHKKHARPYLNLDEGVVVGKNNKERGGSRISSGLNWDKFAKYGFDRPAGASTGPAEVFMASKRMSRYTDSLVTAAVSKVAIDDFFVWVWMSTLSEDQTEVRKATFGRSLIVETMLDDDTRRWVVVEEILSPPPEPMKAPYTADEKEPISLGDKIARRVVSSPVKATTPKRVKSKKKSVKKKPAEKVIVEKEIDRPKRKSVNYSTLDPLAAALNDRLKQPLLDAQTQTYSVEGTQTDLSPGVRSNSIDQEERRASIPPPLPEKDDKKYGNEDIAEQVRSKLPPRELSVSRDALPISPIAAPISPTRLNSPLPLSPSHREHVGNDSPVYGNHGRGVSPISTPISSSKLNSPLPLSPIDPNFNAKGSSMNGNTLPIRSPNFDPPGRGNLGSSFESGVSVKESTSSLRGDSDSLVLPVSSRLSPSINSQDDDDSNSVYYSPRNLTESEDMQDQPNTEESKQSTPRTNLLSPRGKLSSISPDSRLADTSQTSQELSQEDDEGASSDVIDDYYNYYSDDVKSVSHSLQALGITASASTCSADRSFNGGNEFSRDFPEEPAESERHVSESSLANLHQKPLPPPPGSSDYGDMTPSFSGEQHIPSGDHLVSATPNSHQHPMIVTRAVSGSPASEPPTCSPPPAPSHNSDGRSPMLLELTDQSDFADGLSSIAPKWTKADHTGAGTRMPEQKRSVKRKPVGGWTNPEQNTNEPPKVEPLRPTSKDVSGLSNASMPISNASAPQSNTDPFSSNPQGSLSGIKGLSESSSQFSHKAQLQEDEVSASDATNLENSPVLHRDRSTTMSELRGAPRQSDPIAPVQMQRPASYDNAGPMKTEYPVQAPFTRYHERSGSQSTTTSSPNDARLNQYNRNYRGYNQRNPPMDTQRYIDSNGYSVSSPRRQFLVPRNNRGVSDDSTATSMVGGPAQLPPYGPSRNVNSTIGDGDMSTGGLSSGSEDSRGPPIGQGYGNYGMRHMNMGQPPRGNVPLRNNAFGSDWSSSQVDFKQQRNNDLLMGDIPVAPKSKFHHAVHPAARGGSMPRGGPMEAATSISTGPYPTPGGGSGPASMNHRPQSPGIPGGRSRGAGRNSPGGLYPPGGRNSPGGMYGPSGRNSSGGVHCPTGRNSTGGMYGPTGRNSPGGMYGPTGRNSPGGMYGPTGRNSPGGMYGPTGRNSPGGRYGASGRNSPGGVYDPTERNSPGGRYGPSGRNSPGGIYGPSGRNSPGGIYGGPERNDSRGNYLPNSQSNMYRGPPPNRMNHMPTNSGGRMDLSIAGVSDKNPYSITKTQSPGRGNNSQFPTEDKPTTIPHESRVPFQDAESPIIPPQQPYVMEEELMKPTTGQGTPPVVNTAPYVNSRQSNISSSTNNPGQKPGSSTVISTGNQDTATSWGKKPLPLDPKWVEVKANLEASKAENHGSREFLPAIVENAPQLDGISNMNGSMSALDGYVQEASRAVKAPSIYTGEHVKLVEVKDTHGAGNVIPEIDGQQVLASRAREGYVDAVYRQRFGEADTDAPLEPVTEAPTKHAVPSSTTLGQTQADFEHDYYKEPYREEYHLPLNPVYDAIERGTYQPPSGRREMPNPLLMKRESRVPQTSQSNVLDNRLSASASVVSAPSTQSVNFLPSLSPEKKNQKPKPSKEPAYEVVISANDSSVAEARRPEKAIKSSSSHGRTASGEAASRFSLLGLVQAAKGHR